MIIAFCLIINRYI